jgi:hypothetical protein
VSAYTLGGATTSAALGGSLAFLGHVTRFSASDTGSLATLGFAGLLILAREVALPGAPIPQLRRQTRGLWTKKYGATAAALLWGLDIGLVLSTWFTFAGGWLVIILALAAGNGWTGASVVLAYWVGRAASVWLGPWLVPDRVAVPHVVVLAGLQRNRLRKIHAIGLAWVMAMLAEMYMTLHHF